jgi:hypothetical protein
MFTRICIATDDKSLLSGLPPDAGFANGRGPLGSGKWFVHIKSLDISTNLFPRKEDAVKEAHEWVDSRLHNEQVKFDKRRRYSEVAKRLRAGEEITEADLKTLGLKLNSGLAWFIPAAAELFGLTSRQVRPYIKDLIYKSGPYEGVNAKKALEAIARGLR